MDSLTWTQERGMLPPGSPAASVAYRRGCGHVTATVLGTLMAIVLSLILGLSWWWAIASYLGAFLLGAAIGRGIERRIVRSMVFTPSAVRIVRSTSAPVVDIARVVQIDVLHSIGPVDDRRTMVRLTYDKPPAGPIVGVTVGATVGVGVVNRYDPGLAGRLAQLLGPDVPIRETKPT